MKEEFGGFFLAIWFMTPWEAKSPRTWGAMDPHYWGPGPWGPPLTWVEVGPSCRSWEAGARCYPSWAVKDLRWKYEGCEAGAGVAWVAHCVLAQFHWATPEIKENTLVLGGQSHEIFKVQRRKTKTICQWTLDLIPRKFHYTVVWKWVKLYHLCKTENLNFRP